MSLFNSYAKVKVVYCVVPNFTNTFLLPIMFISRPRMFLFQKTYGFDNEKIFLEINHLNNHLKWRESLHTSEYLFIIYLNTQEESPCQSIQIQQVSYFWNLFLIKSVREHLTLPQFTVWNDWSITLYLYHQYVHSIVISVFYVSMPLACEQESILTRRLLRWNSLHWRPLLNLCMSSSLPGVFLVPFSAARTQVERLG